MSTNNLARSRAVVTALVSVCPEFVATHPDLFYSTPRCPRCSSKYTEKHRRDGWHCTEIECGKPFDVDDATQWYHEFDSDVDLLAREHLADLFEVCRACLSDGALLNACRSAIVGGVGISEALMLAAEAALGVGEVQRG
jgi:hypothetical protein